jgi:hypothetical protein
VVYLGGIMQSNQIEIEQKHKAEVSLMHGNK